MRVLFWMFMGFVRHTTSEHLLSAIIEQLCEAGHSVHIIQKSTGGKLPAIPERMAKYEVTTDVIPYQAADKENFVSRYLTELKFINDCKKFVTSGYDAVFIQSNNVAGFAVRTIREKLPKAIITYNVQDIFPYNAMYSGIIKKNSIVFKVLAWIQRYGYRHSDHVITISEDMKDTLVADGTDANKIEVIYNWSYQDELYESIDVAPVAHMFDKKCFNVVYAGNIGIMQNVDSILETAMLMKGDNDVWFHIIGDGVHKEKLELKAKKYGIENITFWPMQSPELAPLIYSSADANMIPLVKDVYKTALPSKTAVCLACQKPIVFCFGAKTKFLTAIRDIGTIFECTNSVEMKDVILLLKDKKVALNKISDFSKFSRTNNSQKYARIITGVK